MFGLPRNTLGNGEGIPFVVVQPARYVPRIGNLQGLTASSRTNQGSPSRVTVRIGGSADATRLDAAGMPLGGA